ncbi:MAG TPA: XRE family transcriptional regulator [Methanobacteriaceae archaeon]|nr:XRE family transcriptional regulator [Methanobacteriaceae archaeon]
MKEGNTIGPKIRQLRESREMTVDELAESSQCNAELIQNLEDGALVPSLTPLLRIAKALGVRLGTFMDDHPHNGPFKLEADKHENVVRFSGKDARTDKSALEFYSLAYGKGDRHMEPFIIDIHPISADDYKLSSHEGEEFVYVLKGRIELLYGQQRFLLEDGDSIYYDSVVPHDLHAHGEDAKILAVVYAPL